MSNCAQCGAEFHCAEADGDAGRPCWCMQLPSLPASGRQDDADGAVFSCLCRQCLQLRLSAPEPDARKN